MKSRTACIGVAVVALGLASARPGDLESQDTSSVMNPGGIVPIVLPVHASNLPGLPARRPALHMCEADVNTASPLLAREDNLQWRRWEGFRHDDGKGRRTRPCTERSRDEVGRRGAIVQRPLLVFLETPPERVDFNQPWLGPVRFDRQGFFTTKEKITGQIFGKGFDNRDPDSVAGWYYRESGGRLVIRGDASSVFTVEVPYITVDPKRLNGFILAALDPVVDFTKRANEFGWVDPIFVITPFSYELDQLDPALTFDGIIGYGPMAFVDGPAFTNDRFPDGTYAALGHYAICHVAANLGANRNPDHPYYGLQDDAIRWDRVYLYAHEYGHTLGLPHQFSMDFVIARRDRGIGFWDLPPFPFNRNAGTGYASSIMNYSANPDLDLGERDRPSGLDAASRLKLGWGGIKEVDVSDPDESRGRFSAGQRGDDEIGPGDRQTIAISEHLGSGGHNPRPEILKINLPPREEVLYPHTDADGNPTGYWRPGSPSTGMVWSGSHVGGMRTMERDLEIPMDLSAPVLSFWTKYGWHLGYYSPGFEHGWVQISTDGGRSWTTLAGETSRTDVDPFRHSYKWFGDEYLGQPAFTGSSFEISPDTAGWIFERFPLPLRPGDRFRLRFAYTGFDAWNEYPGQDDGWFIDDVHLGADADRTRHLVTDFETDRDVRQWKDLLPAFDQGWGFVLAREKALFPRSYLFELRGSNEHDDWLFRHDQPRDLLGYSSFGQLDYHYEAGVVGYYLDEFQNFWAHPARFAGSPTKVPIRQLKRNDLTYPFVAQIDRIWLHDVGYLLSLADVPGLDDATLHAVVFQLTAPSEELLTFLGHGYAYGGFGEFALPSCASILDATPTYDPASVPLASVLPFPDRPVERQPYVIGHDGGWPKSIALGHLGANDPTATTALGQPYLARDAAFHPDRNPIFDDSFDAYGAFYTQLANWHGNGRTAAALAAPTASKRIALVPDTIVPVSDSEVIQLYKIDYLPQDAAGSPVGEADAVRRSYLEQLIYERLSYWSYWAISGACPPPPSGYSIETKPEWEAWFACLAGAVDFTHARSNELVEVARHLSDDPAFSWLGSVGSEGTLSPGLWEAFYVDAWARAKGPPPVQSFGLKVRVQSISKGKTPIAVLRISRAVD